MTLCIFNPEHDLCLGNGDKNFMPPDSALRFANDSASLMQRLYGDSALCHSAQHLPKLEWDEVGQVVLWGVDSRTVNLLLKQEVPARLLPTQEQVNLVRLLQHRASALSLQQEVDALWETPAPVESKTLEEIKQLVSQLDHVVLKSPWSGAGRGLRWVSHQLSDHDSGWATKVLRQQGSVMVEPRRKVKHDYAREYWVSGGEVRCFGHSLFTTENGVYRNNTILNDTAIVELLGRHSTPERVTCVAQLVDHWLEQHVAHKYEGPLGVDLYVDDCGLIHVGEINFRHTMGMVAIAQSTSKGGEGLLTHFLKGTNK